MDFVTISLPLYLGVDAILFGICLHTYLSKKWAVDAIKTAPVVELNNKLKEFVQSQPDHKIPYCALRGTILSLGLPITSINARDITGVVQRLCTKQHVVTGNSGGFWSEQERTIQEVYNVSPFVIQSGWTKVEVLDALKADLLDLQTIADHFEPTNLSIYDHLWGFSSGVQERVLQSTEEMLREGTLITSIGELTLDAEDKNLRIQPPSDGTPFYLTSMPLSSLVRKLDAEKRNLRTMAILFGSIGIVLSAFLARQWWTIRARNIAKAELQRKREENRKIRRRNVRDHDLPENQLCIVCRENPREIILLPCGHVCICEDCSDGIKVLCPVCRATIETKAAAYLS